MRAGISTACLYPMILEKALETLVSMDFRLFEIFINTWSELKKDYVCRLRRMVDAKGGSVISVHPFTSGYESFLLFSDYERRFQDGLDFYRYYFEACNRLGAEILVLHGKKNDKRSHLPEEYFFERYIRLYELGRTFGVKVAQENVNLYVSDEPDFITRMKKYCKNECAFVLDIKQAVRGGVDPYKLCAAMGDKIVHLHLNDNSPDSDCLLPGRGTMDYPRLIRMLKSFGYRGDLIIEVYRRSFGGLSELGEAKSVAENIIS